MKIKIHPVILFASSVVVLWFIVNFPYFVITLSSYSAHYHGELPDPNQALIALFTGLAFVAAGAAYWVQNKALKAAKKQTAIAKEQRMDAACFELLNYLETRKKAIGDQQPFDWIEKCYKEQRWESGDTNKLQKCGTWYRIVMSWLGRVVTAFPNDKELQKKYVDNLLLSLSTNEQRCLKCYSYSAENVVYKTEPNETFLNKESVNSDQLRPFLQNNAQANSIRRLLKDFFEANSVEVK